jgi:hypothetical protein
MLKTETHTTSVNMGSTVDGHLWLSELDISDAQPAALWALTLCSTVREYKHFRGQLVYKGHLQGR